jgi:hypothetical protein
MYINMKWELHTKYSMILPAKEIIKIKIDYFLYYIFLI